MCFLVQLLKYLIVILFDAKFPKPAPIPLGRL